MAIIINFPKKKRNKKKYSCNIKSFSLQRSTQIFSSNCHTKWDSSRNSQIKIRITEDECLKRGKIIIVSLTRKDLEAMLEAI